MANHKITATFGSSFYDGVTSIIITDAGGTFTVDPGAYAISTDESALYLYGFSTITINGAVGSTAPAFNALYTTSGGFASATKLKLNVGADGYLFSQAVGYGLYAEQALTLSNAGYIVGGVGLYLLGSGNAITNSGTIRGTGSAQPAILLSGGGAHKITNTGTIAVEWPTSDDAVVQNAGSTTLVNNGIIQGDIRLNSGDNTITLNGDAVPNEMDFTPYLSGSVITADGADKVTIKGGWAYLFNLGDGADSFTSSGGFFGRIDMGAGADVVNFNGGGSHDSIVLGDGADVFTMTKGQIDGSIEGGAGADKITIKNGTIAGQIDLSGDAASDSLLVNGGKIHELRIGAGDNAAMTGGLIDYRVTIEDGGASFDFKGGTIGSWGFLGGDGADRVTVTKGVNYGGYSLGAGNDTFIGGGAGETVWDGDGSDTYTLGGGNDRYGANNGGSPNDLLDTIDAGAGIDTYDSTNAAGGVTINLFTHTASGAYVGTDDILGFENASGGSGDDKITGDDGANVLSGGWWSSGADTLTGGLGADTLYGADGADVFRYTQLKDSGTTAKTRDTIMDFSQAEGDKIDLTALEAATVYFSFQSNLGFFTGSAGDLTQSLTAAGSIVAADTNGDAKADFSILLKGFYGTLTAGDFVLLP